MNRIAEAVPALLFAAALALFTPRLAVPDRYIFDEVYHAYTAGQYAAGNADAYVWYTKAPRKGVAYMWNHPPAGVHLISIGIRLWGDRPWGWRFMSAVFGAIGVMMMYLLARSLTGRTEVALLAAFLLLMDGLYFVQARTGMLDVFGVTFMMSALLFFHRFWRTPLERAGRWLAASGLFLGLALATKWNAAYASALVGLAALGRVAWVARRRSPGGGVAVARLLGWVGLGLVVVPLAVYGLAYVPFFLAGHDLGEFVELQRQILRYHARLAATHPYQSSWWQWPLALRPVWYHVFREPDRVANVYALANPILHWALLPAVGWVAWHWARERDPALPTLLIGFFGQWLPWASVSRISFAYHFLPAVPFGCVAVALLLVRLHQRPGASRWLARALVLAVAAAFAFFYPILAAVPLAPRALDARMWLPGWR